MYNQRVLGMMRARHNEHGVSQDSREYVAGLLTGVFGAFDETIIDTFDQGIEDGVLDEQMARLAVNGAIGYHWLQAFHQTHGDVGDQLLSGY